MRGQYVATEVAPTTRLVVACCLVAGTALAATSDLTAFFNSPLRGADKMPRELVEETRGTQH